MDLARVAWTERLAFHSELDLRALCARSRETLDLPAFKFDSENATEWGLCEHAGVEYNVSIPYEDGTLQKWDDTVPGWCNVGMTLLVEQSHPRASDTIWVVTTLVRGVGERLASSLDRPVVYHRTSLPTAMPFRPHTFEPPARKP